MTVFISEGGARREALLAVQAGRAVAFTVAPAIKRHPDRSASHGFRVVLRDRKGEAVAVL